MHMNLLRASTDDSRTRGCPNPPPLLATMRTFRSNTYKERGYTVESSMNCLLHPHPPLAFRHSRLYIIFVKTSEYLICFKNTYFLCNFSYTTKINPGKGLTLWSSPIAQSRKVYNRHNFLHFRTKGLNAINIIGWGRKTRRRSPVRAQTLPTGYDRRFLFPQVPPASARPRQTPSTIPTRYEKQLFEYCHLKHDILGMKKYIMAPRSVRETKRTVKI